MGGFDVVTIGSAVKDVMFYSDEISVLKNEGDILRQKLLAVEYGAKIELDQVFVTYGGGAMNVAVGLQNFGLKVAPMVCLGTDWVGREFAAFMKSQKLSLKYVQWNKQMPTGFSIILTAPKDHEHTIFTYKGASTKIEVPERLSKVNTRWFYLGPLSMLGWHHEFEKIAHELERHHHRPYHQALHFAWTPGRKQLDELDKVKRWLNLVDIFIVNKDEAIEVCLKLMGRSVTKIKLNQSKFLLDCLKTLGMKNIVVTAGAKGAYGLDDRGKYYFKPTLSAKIVDTVGAGDAFASGFIAAFHKFHSFDRALDLGLRNSAGTLTRVGAQNGLLKIKL